MVARKVMKSGLKKATYQSGAKHSWRSPGTFTVTVDHTLGKSYGLESTYNGSQPCKVVKVCPGGLLAKWNAAHARDGLQIQPGDVLVSVNGKKTGRAQDTELDRKAPMSIVIRKAPTRRLSTGQHHPLGSGCLATLCNGRPCPIPRDSFYLPYCKPCMKKGDPSLKVVQHPKYGKILIAARNIPKGYQVAWWGDVRKKKEMSHKAMEWALETNTTPKRWIDATPHRGSQLQFTACPGPSEVPTIEFARKADILLNTTSVEKSCSLFATLRPIPKNHQFAMMYSRDEKSTETFFKDMGIKRADVGTRKYPALKKAAKKGKRKA